MAGNRKTITRVGITGAAGRVGQTLTEGLADKYDLTLFYHHREVKQDYHQRFRTVKADLSRAEEVKGIFEGMDAIIHLAAALSHSAWESILINNIVATYNVFEEARRADVGRIVFASSNHVQNGQSMEGINRLSISPFYVRHRGYMRLGDPPAPDSYYGISKLFAENMGWYYWRVYGIQFVALRIGVFSYPDDPSISKGTDREGYVRSMFLSKRDCAEAFERTLQVDTDYLIAYAISDNDRRIFDMKETIEKLGYNPQDNAEDYF